MLCLGSVSTLSLGTSGHRRCGEAGHRWNSGVSTLLVVPALVSERQTNVARATNTASKVMPQRELSLSLTDLPSAETLLAFRTPSAM